MPTFRKSWHLWHARLGNGSISAKIRTINRIVISTKEGTIKRMTVITANDLKTRGMSNIEELLQSAEEIIISVRGNPRYVVLGIEQYERLREQELEATWFQTRADVATGRYRQESADTHIARLRAELDDAL
jgi:prevent-host-death family protein